MSRIYYENLDLIVENDIKNTKSNLATHETKVASSTESGHIKIDDLTLKLNQDGQLYSTLNTQDITTLVEYHQYVLPTTSIGQKSWEIPLATFDPTKDLIIVTHNTTILNDSMYTITSLGNLYSLNITEQIPEAIASNNVFIIILKGKAESPTVPTDLSVDNVTIIKEDNMLKAVNVKGLSVPTQNINEYLIGTESNIQQQINNMQVSLNNMVSGVEYLGRFESYTELNSIAIKYNGDMAVVLTDETKDGGRTLYIYNEPLAMWQFVGAFNIGGGSQFSDNFLELLDTPNNYTGASGKNVSVNVAGTGLEFTDIDYNNIINKPTSTTIAIDSAVTDSHTHVNKTELDRLGINMSDRLTIDGVDYVVDAIGSAVDSAKLYVDNQLTTHDSKDATTTSKGHVQIGSGLSVTNGIVSVTPTTIPNATKTTKGQVQIGNGIDVTNGVISVTPTTTPDATKASKGLVQVGNGLSVASGVISVDATPNASTTTKGIMQVGTGLSVANGVVSTNPIPNATTTNKGIIQIGEGLIVNNGIISIEPTYFDKSFLNLMNNSNITLISGNKIIFERIFNERGDAISYNTTTGVITLKGRPNHPRCFRITLSAKMKVSTWLDLRLRTTGVTNGGYIGQKVDYNAINSNSFENSGATMDFIITAQAGTSRDIELYTHSIHSTTNPNYLMANQCSFIIQEV